MGFKVLAFLAGYQPKRIPTEAETETAKKIDLKLTTKGMDMADEAK